MRVAGGEQGVVHSWRTGVGSDGEHGVVLDADQHVANREDEFEHDGCGCATWKAVRPVATG